MKETSDGALHQPSLTHQWFEDNWALVAPKIEAHLAQKLNGWTQSDLEDHTNEFALKMLRNQSFDPYLKKGKKIYISTLKSWALRHAYNTMKKWARDALQRNSGYRTVTDLKQKKNTPPVTAHPSGHPTTNTPYYTTTTSRSAPPPIVGGLHCCDISSVLSMGHRAEGVMISSKDPIEERVVLKDFLVKFKSLLLDSDIESEQELWEVFQKNLISEETLGKGSESVYLNRKRKRSLHKKIKAVHR